VEIYRNIQGTIFRKVKKPLVLWLGHNQHFKNTPMCFGIQAFIRESLVWEQLWVRKIHLILERKQLERLTQLLCMTQSFQDCDWLVVQEGNKKSDFKNSYSKPSRW